MPQLGETVTEGTILRWLKHPGDRVEIDDGLFEVSTEKVDTEVPSAFAGFLRQVLVEEGETVPVGTLLAVITEGADDEVAEIAVAAPASKAPPQSPSPTPRRSAAGRSTEATGGFLSPAVRALLDERGLDAASVRGSGRDGRITRNDVLAAAANPGGTTSHQAADSDRAPLPPDEPGDVSRVGAVDSDGNDGRSGGRHRHRLLDRLSRARVRIVHC